MKVNLSPPQPYFIKSKQIKRTSKKMANRKYKKKNAEFYLIKQSFGIYKTNVCQMSFSSFKKLVCQKSCFSSKKSENIEYNEYFQRLCLLYKLSYYLFLMKIKLKFSSSNLNLTLIKNVCMYICLSFCFSQ